MVSSVKSKPASSNRHMVFWPLTVSLAGHLLLFGAIVYTPKLKPDTPYIPGIINVQIVDLQIPAETISQAPQAKETPVAIEEKETVEDSQPVVAPKQAPKSEPEVSVAAPKPQKKTALKYKTLKSREVLKSALERLEEKVEDAPNRQLQDTIKRLKDQVAKEGRPESASDEVSTNTTGTAGSKPGIFGQGSEQEAEVIDVYQIEVAYTINKNWAFSEQLAGGGNNLVAALTFKVLPDGTIKDIFFTDRSGNALLDDSAYKAIVKSSPVQPHPPGLARSYIQMGLRFGPKGVQ